MIAPADVGRDAAPGRHVAPIQSLGTSTPVHRVISNMHNLLSRSFGIDLRSLALVRIGLGLVLLADVAVRATDLVAHYTDAGVLPRELLTDQYANRWVWSLHTWSGSAWLPASLFALAAMAASCMTLGVFSRLAAAVSWALLMSLHIRNPLVTNGGDLLLRSLLFWLAFLPIDACWAMRRSGPWRSGQQRIVSVASVAILLQLALVYWTTGYFKLHGGWQAHNVLQQVLQSDCYAKPLAYVLLDYPRLLAGLGWATVWSELVLPGLVFLPFGTKYLRLAAISWFYLLHLGIQLSLTVGSFSYVCWIAWLLFLPSECWDALWRRLGWSLEAASDAELEPPAKFHWPRTQNVLLNAALCGVMFYTVIWNLSQLPSAWTTGTLPRRWQPVADVLGLRQKWSMFQSPMRDDGWYVVVARLEDGRAIDLLRDGAPADWDSYRKPKWIYRRFPNHRWRKYYRNLVSESHARYRESLCRYLANLWQQTHLDEGRVVSVELHYMQELSSEPGEEDRFQQRFLHTLDLSSDTTGRKPL